MTRWALALLALLAALAGIWIVAARDRPARSRGHATPGDGSAAAATDPSARPDDHDPDAPTAHVEGTVRDAFTGGAVSSVDVIFSGDDADITASSGADGRFTASLPPGRYQVRAAGDDLYGLAPAPLDAAAGAQVRAFDVRVARLARVRGRVLDSRGAGVAGATVTFVSDGPAGRVGSPDLDALGTARSDAAGGFELAVVPGAVLLAAAHDGQAGSAELPLVAPAAQLSGVQIVIAPGGLISGHVRDPAGKPVPGAEVAAAWAEERRVVTADAGGAFSFAGLPTGRVVVQARARGFAPSAPESAVARAGQPQTVTLALSAPLSLRGRVLDQAGKPIAGARVRAESGGALPAAETASGADGGFALLEVERGPFLLVADKPGYAPARLSRIVAPRDDLELRLGATGSLAGQVLGPGGRPVTEFTLRLGDVPAAHFVAADGSFRLDGLEPGRVPLMVTAPGFAPARQRVDVPPGAVASVTVTLETGASIEGVVLSARDGSPVAGARVTAMTGDAGDEVTTGADGRFLLPDVAGGRRTVQVEHPGFVVREESGLVLEPGRTLTVAIKLTPLSPDAAGSGRRAIEFAGIGATLSQDRAGQLVIAGLLPGGPAEAAGLAAGEVISAVDGVPTTGRPLGEIIEQIRGVAGTSVRLDLVREGQPRRVDVVRGNVRFEP